jgi:hypothetical protein
LQARVPPNSVLFFDVDEVAVGFLGVQISREYFFFISVFQK